MATPTYRGNAQPPNSGWLGGLGSWFGVSTPAYAGNGQPITASSGYFSGTTPVYRQPVNQRGSGAEPERITLVVPRDMVPVGVCDPQQQQQ